VTTSRCRASRCWVERIGLIVAKPSAAGQRSKRSRCASELRRYSGKPTHLRPASGRSSASCGREGIASAAASETMPRTTARIWSAVGLHGCGTRAGDRLSAAGLSYGGWRRKVHRDGRMAQSSIRTTAKRIAFRHHFSRMVCSMRESIEASRCSGGRRFSSASTHGRLRGGVDPSSSPASLARRPSPRQTKPLHRHPRQRAVRHSGHV
jgi:hypothetical protein